MGIWNGDFSGCEVLELNPTGDAVRRRMLLDSDCDDDNPVLIGNTGAGFYYRDYGEAPGWKLFIPVASKMLEYRTIDLNPENNPDALILRMLKESADWVIGTEMHGTLTRMMTPENEALFTYENPLVISDFAYICYDGSDGEWHLRVHSGDFGERDMKVSEIPRTTTETEEDAVLGAIAAVGLAEG